jgi:hypothetical protein
VGAGDGWYVTGFYIGKGNLEADSSDRWTVPVGLGVGRVIPGRKRPIDIQIAALANVVKPDFEADWTIRLQVSLLFPKARPRWVRPRERLRRD